MSYNVSCYRFVVLWLFALLVVSLGTSISTTKLFVNSLAVEHDGSLSKIPPPPSISMPVWSLACRSINSSSSTIQRDDQQALPATSMNIMTFCTPVSISPKLWALALYPGTLTKESFLPLNDAEKTGNEATNYSGGGGVGGVGILQLLTQSHPTELISILGKQSALSNDCVNKEKDCSDIGINWVDLKEQRDDFMGDNNLVDSASCILPRQVLPECAAYLQLQVKTTVDAGDHVVAICEVTRSGKWHKDQIRWSDRTSVDTPLSLSEKDGILYTGWLRDQGVL